ncbi:hypothetical protein QUC32_27505 (plasmid) [Novosphingobium resinovorum]|uniref:hypothetical protein n=1 Tax=Novosphingobium TaxID=165696 RepID=UPI0025A0450C|nr:MULTISPECIES: hypothetical protein [Novosphingobium]WJM30124.1 hypothetical protein QUC32_27505 [Novosphingobium resinovorum]
MVTSPIADDVLIALAQHRFDQADRADATHEDCRQLRDIFPAVLQRLREKAEITRDLVCIEDNDRSDAARIARLANTEPKQDDQLQLSLTHF